MGMEMDRGRTGSFVCFLGNWEFIARDIDTGMGGMAGLFAFRGAAARGTG